MMRTANPALNANTFTRLGSFTGDRTMTIQGTVNKTSILLLLAFISASWIWNKFMGGEHVAGLMMIGAIGGFITALVTVFKKELDKYKLLL